MNKPVIIGNSTLYHGDCLDLMPQLDSQSVDLILCDLPYGTTECAWDSVLDLKLLWSEYKRIIKPRGAILLTAAQPFTSALVVSNPDWYKCEWIWEKGAATGFMNANKQPLRAHESVLAFYQNQPTFNPQMLHNQQRKTATRHGQQCEVYNKNLVINNYDSTSRYPRSVLFFSSDKQLGVYHPTQKPVALMEYMIRTYSNEGDVVLDNTMGGGTTGVACFNTNRTFIGMESDEVHFNTSCERLFQTVQVPLFA